MRTREHALSLALVGFRVFRIRYGTKGGEGHYVDHDWKREATSDPAEVVRRWSSAAGEPLDYNIGVLAGEDLVILDVDSPKYGAHKADGFESLSALGPLPTTLVVNTPNGGKHFYFKANGQRFGQSRVKDLTGIDIRNGNGYVIGPGSMVNGRSYTVETQADPAPLPEAVAARLRERQERSTHAGEVLGELDTAANLHAVRAYLEAAPVAVEGCGGDAHTYAVCCRALALGVSPDTLLDVMLDDDGWNARCAPPWSAEDLRKKIGNAAHYRQDAVGIDAPSLGFGRIAEPPPWLVPLAPDDFAGRVRSYSGTVESARAIPPRPWIVPGRLVREAVTVVGGYGSVGKSIWSLQLAAAVALGHDVGRTMGLDVKEATEVLVINNEDPDRELDARLESVVTHFGLNRADAWGRIHLYSGHGHKFRLVKKAGRHGGVVDGEMYAGLRNFVRERKIGCVILDPLVSLSEGLAENDNSDMQALMDRLTRLAMETRTAVCVLHHTAKPPQASSESYAGNVNALRGASAVKDAARIAVTMFGMNAKDGERLGIAENVRHRYVRMDDAKANLHLAGPEPDWFYKETVRIPNGEDMMALRPTILREKPKATAGGEDGVILDVLSSFTGDEIRAANVVDKLKADPVFKGRSAEGLAKSLRRAVESGASQWAAEWVGKTGGILRRKPGN